MVAASRLSEDEARAFDMLFNVALCIHIVNTKGRVDGRRCPADRALGEAETTQACAMRPFAGIMGMNSIFLRHFPPVLILPLQLEMGRLASMLYFSECVPVSTRSRLSRHSNLCTEGTRHSCGHACIPRPGRRASAGLPSFRSVSHLQAAG
jgi:hypothetical protein